jgi:hypothetical protein
MSNRGTSFKFEYIRTLGICQNFKINNKLYSTLTIDAKQLLNEYKYVFAWSYWDFKGFPPQIS